MGQRIDTYVPRGAGPAWGRVAEQVRALVKRADPLVPYQAGELLSALARLALFCDGHGVTAAREWLNPTTVDWFLTVGCAHLSVGTRATYRARLRRLSAAIHGVDGAKPCPLSEDGDARPYTIGEQAALWSYASGQPTDALRTGARLLLALGLGCGLSSDEIIQLMSGQVRCIDNGAVLLEVPGRRSRLVLCHRGWEHVLATEAPAARAGYVFCSRAQRAKNLVSNFLARTHRGPTTPSVQVARLRDTWLLGHLKAGTPLPTLVAAGGLTGLGALDRLLPHLPSIDPARAQRHLRDQQ